MIFDWHAEILSNKQAQLFELLMENDDESLHHFVVFFASTCFESFNHIKFINFPLKDVLDAKAENVIRLLMISILIDAFGFILKYRAS